MLAWNWGGVNSLGSVYVGGELVLAESAPAALEGTSWETEADRTRGCHDQLGACPSLVHTASITCFPRTLPSAPSSREASLERE